MDSFKDRGKFSNCCILFVLRYTQRPDLFFSASFILSSIVRLTACLANLNTLNINVKLKMHRVHGSFKILTYFWQFTVVRSYNIIYQCHNNKVWSLNRMQYDTKSIKYDSEIEYSTILNQFSKVIYQISTLYTVLVKYYSLI